MNRRGLLGGLLASLATPAIVRTPGLLMPVRAVRANPGTGRLIDSLWPYQAPSQRLIDLLAEANKVFDDMTWIEGDLATFGQCAWRVDERGEPRHVPLSELYA